MLSYSEICCKSLKDFGQDLVITKSFLVDLCFSDLYGTVYVSEIKVIKTIFTHSINR